MELELRDYQIEAVNQLRDGLRNGHKSQILVLPTGSGKTLCAAEIIRNAVLKNSGVSFIADRISLVDQTSVRLSEVNIEHGVTMGSQTFGRNFPVQVCSAQTLERREFIKDTKLVILDEAHMVRAKTLKMVRAMQIPFIGLTATPFSKGLNEIYSRVVTGTTTNGLIKDNWLVPLKVYCGTEIDMTGAKTVAGEWTAQEVEDRAIPIIGDVVSEWVKYTNLIYGGPVKTLVFSASVDHGAELCRNFMESTGQHFEQISYKDGSTSDARKEKIDNFRKGEITGLISVECLARGFDIPDALCLVVARPYRKSLSGHIQMLGRIMRPSPGKSFGLVLDHASNFLRFAAPTEYFFEHGIKDLDHTKIEELKDKKFENKQRKCFACGFVMAKEDYACPECGHKPERRSNSGPKFVSGTLSKYTDLVSDIDIWPHLCGIANERNPDNNEKAWKFACAQYKSIVGKWPKKGRRLESVDYIDTRVRQAVHERIKAYIRKKISDEKKLKRELVNS